MLPGEVLKQIRRIQIHTSRMVNDVFAGQYQSVFKGRGMEFDEVREYQPGDEIRSIDWNVTARMGHPYIKKFVEERQLTIMLVVDLSASSQFATVNKLKSELAAELSAVLAFSAIRNNDRVGLIIFTDRIEKFVPPKKGINHVLRVIREVLYFKPEGRGTDIALAIEHLNRVTTRRTVSFLISDFMAEGYKKPLKAASKRHDIVAIKIVDPREEALPEVGMLELEDAETGERLSINTGDKRLRGDYSRLTSKIAEETDRLLKSINVDNITIRTDMPYIKPLVAFFRMRERRLR
ncbi:MAG: hypothetical protein AUJ75_00405 [Candidatus Omnitrophica bacterium CG1_02_49_10]|nr:MAG: hypothetical protein AUJ75_00405 [Candidatus Omnitrophica bacterium CG1_02_49_10]